MDVVCIGLVLQSFHQCCTTRQFQYLYRRFTHRSSTMSFFFGRAVDQLFSVHGVSPGKKWKVNLGELISCYRVNMVHEPCSKKTPCSHKGVPKIHIFWDFCFFFFFLNIAEISKVKDLERIFQISRNFAVSFQFPPQIYPRNDICYADMPRHGLLY